MPTCSPLQGPIRATLTKNLETDRGDHQSDPEEILPPTKPASPRQWPCSGQARRSADQSTDWGVLLTLLSQDLGEDVVLGTLALEPVAAAPEGSRPGQARADAQGAAARADSDSPRPQHYRSPLRGWPGHKSRPRPGPQAVRTRPFSTAPPCSNPSGLPFMDGEAFQFPHRYAPSPDSAEDGQMTLRTPRIIEGLPLWQYPMPWA